jgi:hypothetical protein
MSLSGRWGDVQERQLAAFERTTEPFTGYEQGALNALRLSAPDEPTRARIDAVKARQARRDREARARREARLERRILSRLDAVVDAALERGRF